MLFLSLCFRSKPFTKKKASMSKQSTILTIRIVLVNLLIDLLLSSLLSRKMFSSLLIWNVLEYVVFFFLIESEKNTLAALVFVDSDVVPIRFFDSDLQKYSQKLPWILISFFYILSVKILFLICNFRSFREENEWIVWFIGWGDEISITKWNSFHNWITFKK